MLNKCRAKKHYTAILFIVVTFNGKKRCLFSENSGKTMSEYFKNLSKTVKRRYEEKIKEIGVENVEKGDPFLILVSGLTMFQNGQRWSSDKFMCT